MVREYDKVQATAREMRRKGDKFTRELGHLIGIANTKNGTILNEAFPEISRKYRAIAEKKGWYSTD